MSPTSEHGDVAGGLRDIDASLLQALLDLRQRDAEAFEMVVALAKRLAGLGDT